MNFGHSDHVNREYPSTKKPALEPGTNSQSVRVYLIDLIFTSRNHTVTSLNHTVDTSVFSRSIAATTPKSGP